MAKRMSDEQKLFFGSKSQRKAMMKKHPSWAKDKSGFRQTIKGKRNPFKKIKAIHKKGKLTLAKVKAKIKRYGVTSLSAAENAVIEREYRKGSLEYKAAHPKKVATKKTGGGGSTSWGKTLNQLTSPLKQDATQIALDAVDKAVAKATGGLSDLFGKALQSQVGILGKGSAGYAGPAMMLPGIELFPSLSPTPSIEVFQAIDRAITSLPDWAPAYDPQSQYEGALGF